MCKYLISETRSRGGVRHKMLPKIWLVASPVLQKEMCDKSLVIDTYKHQEFVNNEDWSTGLFIIIAKIGIPALLVIMRPCW